MSTIAAGSSAASSSYLPRGGSPASQSSRSSSERGADLAGSLLVDRDRRRATEDAETSPATSAEGSSSHLAAAGPSSSRSPARRQSTSGEHHSRQHRKTPRRRSSSESEDGQEQRMHDVRPAFERRKTPRLDDDEDHTHSSPMRGQSPEVPRPIAKRRRKINLATFPVAELLRPLSNLLQQIASANDAQSAVRTRGAIAASSTTSSTGFSTPNVPPSTPARDLSTVGSDPFLPAGPFSTTTSPAVTRAGSMVALSAMNDPHDVPKLIVEEELFQASKNVMRSPSSSMAFHARNIPTISIEAYLTRILKYCPTTCDVFVSLLVFFDRMAQVIEDSSRKPMILDSYNIHRLLIAGVAVASKFYSDVFYTNSRYAKVGGLPVAELNTLELQFLCLNDFKLLVPVEELERYGTQLLQWASMDDLMDEVEEEQEPRVDRRAASGSTDASGASTQTIRAAARESEPSEDAVSMDEG